MSEELKPCPFCGNKGVGPAFFCEYRGWDIWQIECGYCGIAIESPNGFNGDAAKEAAVERWNTRPTPEGDNEKLVEAVARAIHEGLGGEGWADACCGQNEWIECRESLDQAARAAIAALADRSAAILKAHANV